MSGTEHDRLHQAIVDNDLKKVMTLLAEGGKDAKTLLAKGGKDVNVVEKGPLHVAAEIGNVDVVKALLACGVDVNAADTVGNTALHYAVERGHGPLVRVLLDRAEINPNAIAEHNDRRTPLHIAAEIGNVDVVKALLACGADVNAVDTVGSTALHYAVEKGHEPVVRVLLGRAAIDPNTIAGHIDNKTPLHIATQKGNLGIVQALLSSGHDIDINAGDRLGSTALHYAAVGENEMVVEELLSYCKLHRLDNALTNKSRASPLHLAALFGRHKIVSKLVAAGLPVNKTALWRHTPLHFAVQSGSHGTVEVLLKESEDLKVSEADWRGLTPVEYARQACKRNENGFRPQTLPRQKSPQEDAQKMMQMLERFDKEGLQKERQSCIDSANAILVGAALIASIAFASWLQPPLGFQPAYSSQFLELSPAAPPNTYQPFVYFHSNPMKAFWILNSLSFFAIGSFLLGADVGFPTRYTWQREDMHSMRLAVSRASIFLLVAVVFIVGAFISAGFTDLPSIPQDWGYMIATAVVGGFPCVLGMKQYALKIRGALEDRRYD